MVMRSAGPSHASSLRCFWAPAFSPRLHPASRPMRPSHPHPTQLLLSSHASCSIRSLPLLPRFSYMPKSTHIQKQGKVDHTQHFELVSLAECASTRDCKPTLVRLCLLPPGATQVLQSLTISCWGGKYSLFSNYDASCAPPCPLRREQTALSGTFYVTVWHYTAFLGL